MKYITRNEAIALTTLDLINVVDKQNAEFYSYINNDSTALSCSVLSYLDFNIRIIIRVWYEHDRNDFDSCENLDTLKWTTVGYTVN